MPNDTFPRLPQTYAKSKLTVQELTKYATDAAAEYTGSAKAAAEEVRAHLYPMLSFKCAHYNAQIKNLPVSMVLRRSAS